MRADAEAPNMGLTNWAGSRLRKSDVTISKNYLNAEEIDELNRLTTMFLDYAEDRTRRRQQIRMAEWVAQTDRFLDFNERQVLNNAGRVSQADMQRIAHERFDAFDDQRRARELAEADREAAEEFAALEAEARRLLGSGESDHANHRAHDAGGACPARRLLGGSSMASCASCAFTWTATRCV